VRRKPSNRSTCALKPALPAQRPACSSPVCWLTRAVAGLCCVVLAFCDRRRDERRVRRADGGLAGGAAARAPARRRGRCGGRAPPPRRARWGARVGAARGPRPAPVARAPRGTARRSREHGTRARRRAEQGGMSDGGGTRARGRWVADARASAALRRRAPAIPGDPRRSPAARALGRPRPAQATRADNAPVGPVLRNVRREPSNAAPLTPPARRRLPGGTARGPGRDRRMFTRPSGVADASRQPPASPPAWPSPRLPWRPVAA
jgi:hypothetical protein